MESGGITRTIAIVAAAIVVVGLIIIGSQYWGTITGGAGAALIDIETLPPQILVPRDTYSQMVSLTEEYFTHTDMASRNELMRQLQEILVDLP